MISYLEKFNQLPKDIKAAVASPEATAKMSELSQKYGINLASTVMRVMVKEIKLEGLGAYLINSLHLSAEMARSLENDLRKSIFASVIDYLLGADVGPKLVFSETDERDAKQMLKITETEFDEAIEKALERVVANARIDLSDSLTSGKFRQVIKTYLRSTRDKTATLEALTKATELGGVALSRDAAERSLGAADAELGPLRNTEKKVETKISVPEDKPFKRVVPKDEYDLAASLKEQNIKPIAKPIPKPVFPTKLDTTHEIAPPLPALASPVKKIIKEALAGKPVDKTSLREVSQEIKPIVNMPTTSSGKIRMDDIRFTPRVESPIDELRYMTIKVFRRLNPDPIKATEKIKEKLELLAHDDYGQKIQGIVAWHESPLSKLYLSLCRQALEDGRAVMDILRDELKKEPGSLKPEELSAIIALNRELKF